jgi:TPP-dependent trihydroxycyclohexane-1,2-dione (THcHDO) dehydratase
MPGPMGLAIPIALGVALVQPHREVFALEGDGSLLKQLGCIDTVAIRAPQNLTLVVMDNGIYQITWAVDEADFCAIFASAQGREAPSLVVLRIDEQPASGQTQRDSTRFRDQFMFGINTRGSRPNARRCAV